MIRIGILGYGNLGKGVELGIKQNPDMELVAIFTRRDPESLKAVTNVPVINISEIEEWKGKIDVMILCGGSATDLPEQGPKYAEMFSTIDSFDTHARVPEYYANIDAQAKKGGNLSIISVGWDPGLFSLNRLYAETILPLGSGQFQDGRRDKRRYHLLPLSVCDRYRSRHHGPQKTQRAFQGRDGIEQSP